MLAAKSTSLDESTEKRTDSSRRSIIRAASLILFMPLTVFALWNLPWVQQRLIGLLAEEAEKAAAVKIELGPSGWSSFSTIHLSSLQVESGGKELLRCRQAELTYRLSLEWPYLIPILLVLDQPVLHLEKDDRGRWRIPRSDAPRSPHSGSTGRSDRWQRFPWPEVRIESGRILAEQGGQTVLSLQNVTGTISFTVEPGGDGPTLKIHFGQWQSQAEPLPWGEALLAG